MKTNLFTLLTLVLLSVSCSSDDSNDSGTTTNGMTQTSVTGDFFPLKQDNEWNYNVENTNNTDNTSSTSTDQLKVESVNGDSYTLQVNNNTAANGTMNNLLVSGELTATDTQLTSNGSLTFPIDGVNDIVINFTDAKFYDTTANNGEEIYAQPGTIMQTLQNIPLTINYNLSSTQLENLGAYTVDGTEYTNVTKAKIELELSVTATVQILGTLPVIDTQNVLSINSYYADGVGLIYAESETGYTLNAQTVNLLELAGVDLSAIPTSLSVTNKQTIDTYTIN